METVINALERCAAAECDERCGYNDVNYGCRPKLMLDAASLLKERRWHQFRERALDEEEKKEHPEWAYIMDVECVPGNGEEFLWYRKRHGCIGIASWDDDLWAEYCDTADGDTIEDGDAWMELPKPPNE